MSGIDAVGLADTVACAAAGRLPKTAMAADVHALGLPVIKAMICAGPQTTDALWTGWT